MEYYGVFVCLDYGIRYYSGGGLYVGCWTVREELAKAEAGKIGVFIFPMFLYCGANCLQVSTRDDGYLKASYV